MSHRVSPETIALRNREEAKFFAYLEQKRPEMRLLAHFLLYEPVTGSHELATKLNLSISQVESLKRALRRATQEYFQREEFERPSATGKD